MAGRKGQSVYAGFGPALALSVLLIFLAIKLFLLVALFIPVYFATRFLDRSYKGYRQDKRLPNPIWTLLSALVLLFSFWFIGGEIISEFVWVPATLYPGLCDLEPLFPVRGLLNPQESSFYQCREYVALSLKAPIYCMDSACYAHVFESGGTDCGIGSTDEPSAYERCTRSYLAYSHDNPY